MTAFLNENSFRAYPFKEAQQPVFASGVLPDDIILELNYALTLPAESSFSYKTDILKLDSINLLNTSFVIFTFKIKDVITSIAVPRTAPKYSAHTNGALSLAVGDLAKLQSIGLNFGKSHSVISNGEVLPSRVTFVGTSVSKLKFYREPLSPDLANIPKADRNLPNIFAHINKQPELVQEVDFTITPIVNINSGAFLKVSKDTLLNSIDISSTSECDVTKPAIPKIIQISGATAENILIGGNGASVRVGGNQITASEDKSKLTDVICND